MDLGCFELTQEELDELQSLEDCSSVSIKALYSLYLFDVSLKRQQTSRVKSHILKKKLEERSPETRDLHTGYSPEYLIRR
jgi:hypothetical protein